jgi:hypothetical protein
VQSTPPFAALVKAPGWILRSADGRVSEAPGPNGEIRKDLTLRPGTTVRGRVVDAQGSGVGGARVTVALSASTFDAYRSPDATTADDGSYAVFDVGQARGLAAMATAFMADAPVPAGPAKARVRVARDGFVDGESAEFDVVEGGHVEAPAVTLSRGATVRGVVLDPSGNPAPHARLQVKVESKAGTPRLALPGLDAGVRAVLAGADGRFEADGLAEGKVTLTATRGGLAPARSTVEVSGTGQHETTLRLRRARDLRGRVVGAGGAAIAGASVFVTGDLVGVDGDDAYLEPQVERSAADGSFSFRGLPPGRVRLRVTADGQVETVVEAETGGPSVEIAMSPRSSSDAERLKEIQAETARLMEAFGKAKTDEERQALQQKWAALLQEQQRIEKGSAR